MSQRILELEYDKLVIGSDLNALSYSYYNNAHIISCRNNKPISFDIEDGWEYKIDLWSKYAFHLSHNGLMPFGDKINVIRLEENLLKAVTKENLLIKIKYNNLFLSDDYMVEGLPPIYYETDNKILIHDYFDVTSGMNHDLRLISSEDELVSKLYFYKSIRQHNWPNSKDCVAVSLIDMQNIDNEDYSNGIVRIKTLKMMKQAGIKGKANGKITKFRPVNIQYNRREVFSIGKKIYTNLYPNMQMLEWNWELNKENVIRTSK